MTERNKITISFLPNEEALWQFVQSKKDTCNISEYVRALIKKDMNLLTDTNDEEALLQKILQKLDEREGSQYQSKKSIDDMLGGNVTKDTINNLF